MSMNYIVSIYDFISFTYITIYPENKKHFENSEKYLKYF